MRKCNLTRLLTAAVDSPVVWRETFAARGKRAKLSSMQYAVLLIKDEDVILATVPDCPGVIATGADEADAIERARSAIADQLAELRADGVEAPAPSTKVVMVEAT